MKIHDMILVIENNKGNDKNMLITPEDFEKGHFFAASVSEYDMAASLKELYETRRCDTGKWVELHFKAEKSYRVKFCRGSNELQCFLIGAYNNKEFMFDTGRSSKECVRALKEYNLDVNGRVKGLMFHYEQEEYEFKQGEILHNFNETDYKVIECFSEKNFLMMSMESGQHLVAVGMQYYSRYPYAGEYTKGNAEMGIEWGHGVYLSAKLSDIDLPALRAEYCEPDNQMQEAPVIRSGCKR